MTEGVELRNSGLMGVINVLQEEDKRSWDNFTSSFFSKVVIVVKGRRFYILLKEKGHVA